MLVAGGSTEAAYTASAELYEPSGSDTSQLLGDALADLDIEEKEDLLELLAAADHYVELGQYDDATDKLHDLIDKLEDHIENGTLSETVGNGLIAVTEDYIAFVESL